MAHIKQTDLDAIKSAGVEVRQSLVDLESHVSRLVRRYPHCPRIQSLKLLTDALHADLSVLRSTILDATMIEPLNDEELTAMGCPPELKC